MTDIKEGSIYQSRGFSHISRKVQRIKGDVVIYSIIDDRHPDASWRKMATAPLSEFKKVSILETA